MKGSGFKIVLTADRTLMADYRLLFDGMLASSQTSSIPPFVTSNLLMPWRRMDGICALTAPLGLRRIEAALINGGFSPDDVAIVDERHLHDAVGPNTQIVAVTSGEPTGHGMNSTTMTEIAGGKIFPQVMFAVLMSKVRRYIDRFSPNAKVVMGGPGAWQIAEDSDAMRKLGIDHVVTGYAEGNAAEIFRSILAGDNVPTVIQGAAVSADAIPPIRGASTMGVVEISRGCGLGCSFCTIARVPMLHLPESTIVSDVETNIAAGMTSIAVLSEDFFRYGADGVNVNPEAVISLLTRLREIKDLRLIQIDHANILSISQYSDDQLQTIYNLLTGETGCKYPWVNIGIETVSGELLKASGGAAKMGRNAPADWGEFADRQLKRLLKIGFLPMASLVIGLPDETEDDIRQTLKWVESMSNERITIFPVLYAPIDGGTATRVGDLTRMHWKLIKACYKLNFKWIPKMYWDNQMAAGVPFGKALLLQILGNGQVLQWNALFALHGMRAKR